MQSIGGGTTSSKRSRKACETTFAGSISCVFYDADGLSQYSQNGPDIYAGKIEGLRLWIQRVFAICRQLS